MADVVQQFRDISMQLVNEAMDYAKGGIFIEETDANIRQVRITTQVLLAALLQAASVQPPSSLPPPP